MGIKMSDLKNSAPRILPPEGPTLGICYQIIDLGTHVEDGQWGKKTKRKVRFTFELPNETHVFKEEKGEEPFVISTELPLFFTEKANFFKLVKSWTGKEPTIEFDIETLLGKPGTVNVTYSEPSKDGTVYANISGVIPVMKGVPVPRKPHNPCLYWDITNGKDSTFDSFPEFLRKKIESCLEWNQETPDDAAANKPDDGELDPPF